MALADSGQPRSSGSPLVASLGTSLTLAIEYLGMCRTDRYDSSGNTIFGNRSRMDESMLLETQHRLRYIASPSCLGCGRCQWPKTPPLAIPVLLEKESNETGRV